MQFLHLRTRDTRKMVSLRTCIEPGKGRDLPSCPLCPMLPWKDMSDPGKAWQDKTVFPDAYTTAQNVRLRPPATSVSDELEGVPDSESEAVPITLIPRTVALAHLQKQPLFEPLSRVDESAQRSAYPRPSVYPRPSGTASVIGQSLATLSIMPRTVPQYSTPFRSNHDALRTDHCR